MKKPIQISIPTPCHETWDAMSQETKGRFCASCQKTVIDFTNSSDREIATVLKNNNNACGRFRSNQLERELVVPKEKSSVWMAASAAVVSFLTIGNDVVSAQTSVNTIQTDLKTDEIIGKVAPAKTIVTGTVKDSEGIVVMGANVTVRGSKEVVQTDFDGNFSIEVNQGDIVAITFIGMQTQEITVTGKKTYSVVMPNDILQGDLITMVGGISVRRTFFGRIFHSIGSVFR